MSLNQPEIDRFFSKVSRASSSALLLDYDGTIAPFSSDRQRARPYPGAIELLQQIADSGRTRLIVITGRNAYDVNPLLGLNPALEVWGSHGLQRLRPDGTCEMPKLAAEAVQALGDAERWLAYQGLQKMAEPKPGSLAVHWRGFNENAATELRGKILLGWSRIAESAQLSVLEFDGGVELRVADRDKGDAIRFIEIEMGSDVPIAFLGDDITDELAFRALRDRGLTVLVRDEWRQTTAQLWLRPPGELLEFLSRWLAALEI